MIKKNYGRLFTATAAMLASIAFAAMMPSAMAVESEAAAVFEKVKKSVVVVRVFDTDGKQSAQGSGVVTAKNEVTTNCHVVENAVRVEVVRQGEEKAIAAEITTGNVGRDLCLLSAKGLTNTAKIRSAKDLQVGENVYAVGSPQGWKFSISSGIVSQLRSLGEVSPLIQTDAAISEGSSGGGLFDGAGNLVGITTFYYRDGQNLNFAIPSEWITDARLNKSPFSESESTPQISAGSSLGFFDKAVELEAAEDWNGMLTHCKQWAKLKPKNADSWFCLGNTYNGLGRSDDAIDAYRKALRINPEYPSAWNNLGYAYDNLGHYDDAIDAYRKALRINPEYAGAWISLGNTYDNLGHYDDAIDAYRKALRINPEDALAWNNLGYAYNNLGHYDDAIDACRKALRINPEDALAWNNLGISYRNLNRYDDAIAAYREALRINPEGAVTWYNLGITYKNLNRYDDAIDAYRKALRINPEYAGAWSGLGISYDDLGRYDDAIAAYREALRINPEGAVTWYNLGITYKNLGRYDDAIAAWREALRINPEDADTWQNLSIAYRKVGRNTEADEAYQTHLRLKILNGE